MLRKTYTLYAYIIVRWYIIVMSAIFRIYDEWVYLWGLSMLFFKESYTDGGGLTSKGLFAFVFIQNKTNKIIILIAFLVFFLQ
jgi:hypothetical protein